MDALLKALGEHHKPRYWFWIEDELCEPCIMPTSTIQKAVACHFGLRVHDLKCHVRRKEVVNARHVGIYLARQFTTNSYPAIGRQFGDVDHSTVMYGERRIKKMLSDGHPISRDIEQIKVKLLVASASKPSQQGQTNGNRK